MRKFPHSPAEQSAGLFMYRWRQRARYRGGASFRRYAFFAPTGTGTPAIFRLTENRVLRLVK
jgi:hypothetical protein